MQLRTTCAEFDGLIHAQIAGYLGRSLVFCIKTAATRAEWIDLAVAAGSKTTQYTLTGDSGVQITVADAVIIRCGGGSYITIPADQCIAALQKISAA